MRDIHKGSIYIIQENVRDRDGIRSVNIAAFGREGEADIVDQLRKSCSNFISIVAKRGEEVIGHILFTPAHLIQEQDWSIGGMGLAPLAVHPEFQNQGVGTQLCREGLKQVTSAGYPFVVVLGDPAYYQRFGFEPASQYGIRCAYKDVPEEYFMIKNLKPKVMAGAKGVVYYQQEFDSVS